MLDQVHMTSLFENATEGIILTNGKGVIVVANPAAEIMFGYSKNELVNQPIEVLIPEKFKSVHHEHREGFYKKPSNRTMGHGRDLYGRKMDGSELPVEISLSHYERDSETFVIAFIVDITGRKQIENRMLQQKAELEMVTEKIRQLNAELEIKVEERTLILKEALQKLEQSQEELSGALDKERQLNEIKSRFVSMASHEFRTPLTTVLSSASLISKYTSGDEQEKRDKHIQRIKKSVNNLNDILEDFLSLGKLNEGKLETLLEEINLGELIADTLDEMKAIIKKDQYFELELRKDCNGFTDKKLFRNIIINLVSNAVKFSEEGAKIVIRGNVKDGLASISVIDQGIGISDNDKEHLFSSFFRAANATNIQGTGLGLHIVKRYVDLLGGKVSVESELHRGTTVNFTIPVKK
ncbi:MAG: PAS domain S-box protein [Chitinophagaceae bacterium]|nr:PAS domain S-box protein [Chitinophagaceae bacterium]MBP6476676.1 PAS domain S-box protein [Chitinophagaceae bacterium]MBP7109540.1 PAS domain S-box protein [Chitinophagaceae bacterium]MBP7315547.1 PAS domain S-box protein [Chitinophagaceae bacterium]